MRIVTWNINSIKVRADFVGLYLDKEAPDVLCIQELKVPGDMVPRALFEDRGYHVAFHAQKTWNGVLIASKQPITDVHEGLGDAEEGQARLIAATTAGIRFVNLYCPQGQSADSPKFHYKLRFYEALREWIEEEVDLGQPAVVLGDLNIAPTADDIWDPFGMDGVPSFHPAEHEEWELLLELGLHDAVRPHVAPGTYSFWDYRGGAFHRGMGMRIDHILVSTPLLERVEGAWIDRAERKKKEGLTPSDHAPVGVTLA